MGRSADRRARGRAESPEIDGNGDPVLEPRDYAGGANPRADYTHTQRSTSLRKAINAATEDDQAFLQKVLQSVPYGPDFFNLPVQDFWRVRAVAFSDAFESIDDRFRLRYCEPKSLLWAREAPEYPIIQERLRLAASLLGAPINNLEDWMNATTPLAQKAVSEVLIDKSAPAKHRVDAAAMVLDRRMPKYGRGDTPSAGVLVVDEKSMGLLTKALEIMQAREVKQIEAGGAETVSPNAHDP